MGVPLFQIQELVTAHNIHVFSSNYTLYGDMSARLMACLGRFVEDVEVYSIDEAFLKVDGYEGLYPSYRGLGETIRATADSSLSNKGHSRALITGRGGRVTTTCLTVFHLGVSLHYKADTLIVYDLWGVTFRQAVIWLG